MGFSLKIAPGVRIRASRRGLRTSVGPRALRMHVGAGRTGLSSNVGPFDVYSSTRGRRSSSSGTGKARGATISSRSRAAASGTTAAANRALAAAAKAEKAQEAEAALDKIRSIHRQSFAAAEPPLALPVPVPSLGSVVRGCRRRALSHIRLFAREDRMEAKKTAAIEGVAEHARIVAEAERKWDGRQAELDHMWHSLLSNDPDVTMTALATAFEDNEASAAPLGVVGSTASIVVQVPDKDAVPERRPGVTEAGNLSLRKMTKTESSDFYKLMVCGYMIATVKEAFAVAPGLTDIAVVAVRRADGDAPGQAEAIVAARFQRESLAGIAWESVTAAQVFNDAATEKLLIQKGSAKQLQPLDIGANPDIRDALEAVDLNPSDTDLDEARNVMDRQPDRSTPWSTSVSVAQVPMHTRGAQQGSTAVTKTITQGGGPPKPSHVLAGLVGLLVIGIPLMGNFGTETPEAVPVSAPSTSIPTASPSATSRATVTSSPVSSPFTEPTATASLNVVAGETKALAALAMVPVKGRAPQTDYRRSLFGQTWADVDRNGCDTRNDILARDLRDLTYKAGTNDCLVLTGVLSDPYTATTIDFVGGDDVQIDHVVALGDAWQKGAQQLGLEARTQLANDPLNLLAVDGPTNQQKGDGDAATWLPPNKSFRCQYVARQVAVKSKYNLWMTQAEATAIAGILQTCPDQQLVDTAASPTPSPTPTPVQTQTPVSTPAPPVDEDEPVRVVDVAPDVYFKNCTAARAAGYAPLLVGQPGYRKALDRDGDGVACEN